MPQIANGFATDPANMERYHLNQAGVLRVFEVKPSTYNGLVKRQEELADVNSARARKLAAQKEKDNENKRQIINIVKARNGCVPGHRTMQLELVIRYNKYLSVKSIRYYKRKLRLMTNVGKKPYKGEDTYLHPMLSPGNLVARCFYMGYRRVILTDITYFKYDLGNKVCYHIEFYDPFMDKVLGMATADSLSVEFVKEAYEKMMQEHKGEFCNPGVYVHSDNGSQLLETSFSEMVRDNGFIRSVSRPGTPGDNRPMEAKFSRLKGNLEEKLLLCRTTEQVREMIEGCINDHEENDHCLSLGGLTPNQFEQYILTGVNPLDSYYDVSADELHPINRLITKLKETAHARTERAKKEKAEHAEKLKLIRKMQEVNPAAVMEMDQNTIREEKTRCLRGKHSLDTDLKLLEIVDEKLAAAITFIRKATPDTLEKLKDRANWKDYQELQYVNDFPQHKDGRLIFDREKLGDGLTGPAALWLAVEDFMTGVIDFFEKASPHIRKLLEDPKNWGMYPELSFLDMYPIHERLALEDGAGI